MARSSNVYPSVRWRSHRISFKTLYHTFYPRMNHTRSNGVLLALVLHFRCSQDLSLLGHFSRDVDNPHIIYADLFAFRFASSTRILFICEMLGCNNQSSACDIVSTVKPVLSDHIKQDIFLSFHTGGCLLLHERSAKSCSCRCYSALLLFSYKQPPVCRNFHVT